MKNAGDVWDVSPEWNICLFGHADGDGHLAVEQSRVNLREKGVVQIRSVVSAATTGARFWERSFRETDFTAFDLVVVVDIAFKFKDPSLSFRAVEETVNRFPRSRFMIIDHHPLPADGEIPANLTLIEASSPYECCFGRPSDELMVVAALCHGDEKAVDGKINGQAHARALGVRRAAADTHGVAGDGLLGLLRKRDWGFFERLAAEPLHLHQTARGRRKLACPPSPLLNLALGV